MPLAHGIVLGCCSGPRHRLQISSTIRSGNCSGQRHCVQAHQQVVLQVAATHCGPRHRQALWPTTSFPTSSAMSFDLAPPPAIDQPRDSGCEHCGLVTTGRCPTGRCSACNTRVCAPCGKQKHGQGMGCLKTYRCGHCHERHLLLWMTSCLLCRVQLCARSCHHVHYLNCWQDHGWQDYCRSRSSLAHQ